MAASGSTIRSDLGWELCRTAAGVPYYYNTATGESTWAPSMSSPALITEPAQDSDTSEDSAASSSSSSGSDIERESSKRRTRQRGRMHGAGSVVSNNSSDDESGAGEGSSDDSSSSSSTASTDSSVERNFRDMMTTSSGRRLLEQELREVEAREKQRDKGKGGRLDGFGPLEYAKEFLRWGGAKQKNSFHEIASQKIEKRRLKDKSREEKKSQRAELGLDIESSAEDSDASSSTAASDFIDSDSDDDLIGGDRFIQTVDKSLATITSVTSMIKSVVLAVTGLFVTVIAALATRVRTLMGQAVPREPFLTLVPQVSEHATV